MPYDTNLHKSVLISKSNHPLLLKLMEVQGRNQQQTLDFLIRKEAKKEKLL